MSIKITWLGHSAFVLEAEGHTIVLDPFLTGNPLAAAKPEDLNPEMIFLSHAHGDHLGDTVDIAKRTGALVVSNAEICNWMDKQGVKNTHGMNSGGGYNFGFVHAKMTVAHHSSSFPDGTYGGNANGFVLTLAGKRLYYAGDTSLFSDMRLIGDQVIDLAFLPIGDNFTMGPEDSLRAINYIRPRAVIPMHYKTWPPIDQDASVWGNAVNNETTAQPIVLDPGASHLLI
ncbi:MAG: metal-dependent hydrolase [Anaerolineaceae bacterium]|nr:metal-dependent hydrolase [Anaerolineaceae bacterium]